MDKDALVGLMQQKAPLYEAFLKDVSKNAHSEKWGKGIDPYFFTPYKAELLGIEPGRFLKTGNEPAAGRHRYFLDQAGRYLGKVEYLSQTGGRWMVKWDFYEYEPDQVILYRFRSCFEDATQSGLSIVCVASLSDGNVVGSRELTSTGDYSESDFVYSGGDVTLIRIRTKPGSFVVERDFEVSREDDGVRIFRVLEGGERKQVYPKP